MPNQRAQALDVLAMAVAQEAEAFARGFARGADTDVIQACQAHAVDREGSAADIAADFLEYVIVRTVFIRNREEADAERVGRSKQANDA